MVFFFFSSRRRHTRSLRDWSSDVCSSDLPAGQRIARQNLGDQQRRVGAGGAGDRKSGVEGKRGDLGGRRIIKKKKKKKKTRGESRLAGRRQEVYERR